MQPAHPEVAEQVVPVHVPGPELGCGRVSAVGDPDRSAYPEAAFGEVQAVAYRGPDAVVGDPLDERGVQAAGEDEVLDQAPDLVVRQRRDDRGAQAERPAQAAGDVVLPAALPGPEGPGGADPPFAGVQAQHHLTQGHRVEAARRCGSDEQVSHRGTPFLWSVLAQCLLSAWVLAGAGQRWAAATASALSCWIPAKSPALTRSRAT